MLRLLSSLFIFLGMMSLAFADACDDDVIMSENIEHVYPYGGYSGDPLQRFKGWMKNQTAQELDEAAAKLDCGRLRPIADGKRDNIMLNLAACKKLKPLMTCYQALGWPISRNPRKVAKVIAEPTVAAVTTFESVRGRGGGAIMDFAAQKGCLSAATVRIDECRKYSAAAVPDLWRTLKCEQKPGDANCKSLLNLNDNLGPYKLNLPGALASSQVSTAKSSTDYLFTHINSEEERLNCNQNISNPDCQALEKRRSNLMNNRPEMEGATPKVQPDSRQPIADSKTPEKCAKEVGAKAGCRTGPLTQNGVLVRGNVLICTNTYSYSLKVKICSSLGGCRVRAVPSGIDEEPIEEFPGDEYKVTTSDPYCE